MKKYIYILILIIALVIPIVNVKADNTNLANIPLDWGDYNGNIVFHTNPQICFLDNNITHNGNPSMRLDKHIDGYDVNFAREIDGKWYNVKAGDIITFSAYIKMNESTLGLNGDIRYGGRISLDYYDNYGYIEIKQSDDKNILSWYGWDYTGAYNQNGYVPFNSDWTLRQIVLVVPQIIIDVNNVVRHPNTFVLWVQVLPVEDGGAGYFSDTTLQISTPQNNFPTNTPINNNPINNNPIVLDNILNGANQTAIGYLFIFGIFAFIIATSLSIIFTKKR